MTWEERLSLLQTCASQLMDLAGNKLSGKGVASMEWGFGQCPSDQGWENMMKRAGCNCIKERVGPGLISLKQNR